MKFTYALSCVIHALKHISFFANDSQKLINAFKKKGIIVNEDFVNDIDEYDYRMEKILQWEDPLPDPHVILDHIKKMLITNFPTLPEFQYLEELKMRVLKMTHNIMNDLYQEHQFLNRKEVITSSVNMSDITSIIEKYDSYFTGQVIVTIKDNKDYSHASKTISAILSNNRIITSHEGNIQLTIRNLFNNEVESVISIGQHLEKIISLPNERILITHHLRPSSVWNLKTRQKEHFPLVNLTKDNFDILPNGRLILPSTQGRFEIWENEEVFGEASEKSISVIKILKNNKVAIISQGIEIWDLKTRKFHFIPSDKNSFFEIKKIEELSNDRLLIIDYFNVRILNLKTEKMDLLYNSSPISSSLLLENERLILAHTDYNIKIINLNSKEVITQKKFNIGQIDYIKQIGSEILLASKYGTLGIWDIENDTFRYNFKNHREFSDLQVLADGRVVVSIPGEVVKVLK